LLVPYIVKFDGYKESAGRMTISSVFLLIKVIMITLLVKC